MDYKRKENLKIKIIIMVVAGLVVIVVALVFGWIASLFTC